MKFFNTKMSEYLRTKFGCKLMFISEFSEDFMGQFYNLIALQNCYSNWDTYLLETVLLLVFSMKRRILRNPFSIWKSTPQNVPLCCKIENLPNSAGLFFSIWFLRITRRRIKLLSMDLQYWKKLFFPLQFSPFLQSRITWIETFAPVLHVISSILYINFYDPA